jgi:ankyrin repeat protein
VHNALEDGSIASTYLTLHVASDSLCPPFADALAAVLAAIPKPEPTLVDTAFILAQVGYVAEVVLCLPTCSKINSDGRILEYLSRARFGPKKRTLLMAAAEKGQTARAARLIECGADVRAQAALTPPELHMCCKVFEIQSTDGRTVLHYACRGGSEAIVQMLLDRGCATEARAVGETPLSDACKHGHLHVARLLLAHGAAVDSQGASAFTPLHEACSAGRESVARFLLDSGASVEAQAEHMITPLHLACEYGFESVARLLLDRGALVGARDIANETPLHLCSRNGHVAIAQLLHGSTCLLPQANSAILGLSSGPFVDCTAASRSWRFLERAECSARNVSPLRMFQRS